MRHPDDFVNLHLYFFLSIFQAGRRFGPLYPVVRRLLEGVRQVLQSQPGRVHTTGAPAYVFQVKYSGSEERFSFTVQITRVKLSSLF